MSWSQDLRPPIFLAGLEEVAVEKIRQSFLFRSFKFGIPCLSSNKTSISGFIKKTLW